jgi:hypothetical protein
MCDFDLQKCKGGLDTTYFGKEGFGREIIRIFPNNLLEKTTIVLRFIIFFFFDKNVSMY